MLPLCYSLAWNRDAGFIRSRREGGRVREKLCAAIEKAATDQPKPTLDGGPMASVATSKGGSLKQNHGKQARRDTYPEFLHLSSET